MTGGTVQLVRVAGPPEGFETLRREAAAEGFGFLDRLADDLVQGAFAGEADLPVLLAALRDGTLAGLGGLTRDPYDPAPDLVRVRHVYVAPAQRGSGVGGVLASALVQQGFAIAGRLSLRAADARAAAFWEAQGFSRVTGDETRTHMLRRNGDVST